VNAIPAEATMDIDMRSESPAALAALDGRVRATLAEALAAENARWPKADTRLTLVIDTIGIRPAGAQPDSAPIVRTALAAARALGFTSQTAASSTDANVPMALGIPAITLDGGGREEGSHSLSEYFDDGPNGWLGPQWVALVVASLARLRR
jgi:acetylornithine deacetylase/succinyl-diaminopimelate desuccinylase-like protein